mmetsp:Transcript_42201/g.59263  ORF Transcript_42201/g.59263 Transcript_42201/m.59263 type:complete len:182 (+) Transcript_42201:131-676(+)
MEPEEDTPLLGSATEPHGLDNCFTVVFHTVRLVAVIASICGILAQSLTLAILNEGIMQDFLRYYVCIFCICFILAELNIWQRRLTFLVNFIFRGFMYTFIAVILIEEAQTVKISKNVKTHKLRISFSGEAASVFVYATAFAIFLVGIIYVIMGALCLRRVYDRVILGKLPPGIQAQQELIV